MIKIRFAFVNGFTKSLKKCEGARERLSECKNTMVSFLSGVAPCVNPSKNCCGALMERPFDEVGLLIKNLFCW